ncbi:MAG TPA: hypothetical protein VJU61_07360 [Polyangiaceae bacterium]|nr:hypothetical protein [Polyangiaceae bacterium]
MTSVAHFVSVALVASGVAACSGSSQGAADGEASSSETMMLAPAQGADEEEPAGALPGSFGAPECDQCLEGNCGEEVAACNARPVCESALRCVTGCLGKPEAVACFGGCLNAGEVPPMEFPSFLQCLSVECQLECANRP